MSPKIQYPLPNIDLSEIIVPGLKEAIAKAQITADNAKNAADAAQEFAESVFGELKALKMHLECILRQVNLRQR